MNYQEYSPLAIRTAKFIDPATDLFHARVGIITEVGEICDAFKRHIIYGKPLDLANLKEEIGDVFWYINLLWNVTGNKGSAAIDFKGSSKLDSGAQAYLLQIAANASQVALGTLSPQYLVTQLEYLCHSYDIDLGECLDINIAKLAARYGDKYSDYRALNRDLVIERAVLEDKA